MSVAVPSRMASEHPNKRPLEGCRIAVKDAFDTKGLRTSNCCRAYLRVYPPAERSAPPVQKLFDQGACILGKTKLSFFLSRKEPSESVDFPTACNPRGDGYPGPDGSSSGSTAAVGSRSVLGQTVLAR